MAKGIRINKSKIVHLYLVATNRTDCGAGGMSDADVNGTPTDDAITCKRCLKAIASMVEQAHAEAVEMDERRTIARAYLSTASGVVLSDAEVGQALADRDAENEAYFDALAVEHAHADAVEENKRREFAAAAEELKAQDRTASAKLLQLVSASVPASRRQRRAARRALRAAARRRTPQTRAAARAGRVRRGAARGIGKALVLA